MWVLPDVCSASDRRNTGSDEARRFELGQCTQHRLDLIGTCSFGAKNELRVVEDYDRKKGRDVEVSRPQGLLPPNL